jgi:2-methylcitrate dehydratase PrpD
VSTAVEPSTTTALRNFITRLQYERLSEEALATARLGILDCVGVALAGALEPPGRHAARFVAQQSRGSGGVPVWGASAVAPSSLAALANGTAAHALDYDDVNWSLIGHPSASLVPCLFALAAERGAGGRAVLTGYIVGLEVMARFGQCCQPAHSLENRWHPTSSIGSIGCAAAAASLLQLNAEQTGYALALAASTSGGLVRNFGTMTKPLHAGLAAQHGLTAASLAELGFTANPTVFDAHGGWHDAFCKGLTCRRERLLTIGEPLDAERTGLTIKPYPCGVANHPAVDAVLELRSEAGLTAADVISGHIGVTRYTFDKLFYGLPATGLEAKFSMPYAVARALLDGGLTLGAFTDTAATEPRVQELAARFTMAVDDEIEANWNGGSRPCRVRLVLRDGRRLERLIDISKGNREKPLSRQELHTKFMDCATRSLAPGAATELLENLEQLDKIEDVSKLNGYLAGPSH